MESVEVEPKFEKVLSSDDLGTLRFELDGSRQARASYSMPVGSVA